MLIAPALSSRRDGSNLESKKWPCNINVLHAVSALQNLWGPTSQLGTVFWEQSFGNRVPGTVFQEQSSGNNRETTPPPFLIVDSYLSSQTSKWTNSFCIQSGLSMRRSGVPTWLCSDEFFFLFTVLGSKEAEITKKILKHFVISILANRRVSMWLEGGSFQIILVSVTPNNHLQAALVWDLWPAGLLRIHWTTNR